MRKSAYRNVEVAFDDLNVNATLAGPKACSDHYALLAELEIGAPPGPGEAALPPDTAQRTAEVLRIIAGQLDRALADSATRRGSRLGMFWLAFLANASLPALEPARSDFPLAVARSRLAALSGIAGRFALFYYLLLQVWLWLMVTPEEINALKALQAEISLQLSARRAFNGAEWSR